VPRAAAWKRGSANSLKTRCKSIVVCVTSAAEHDRLRMNLLAADGQPTHVLSAVA
jgi:hypothetical protein